LIPPVIRLTPEAFISISEGLQKVNDDTSLVLSLESRESGRRGREAPAAYKAAK
jgi:hypothetical protein